MKVERRNETISPRLGMTEWQRVRNEKFANFGGFRDVEIWKICHFKVDYKPKRVSWFITRSCLFRIKWLKIVPTNAIISNNYTTISISYFSLIKTIPIFQLTMQINIYQLTILSNALHTKCHSSYLKCEKFYIAFYLGRGKQENVC